MNTTIKNENGRQTVYFEGRLDTAAAPQANIDVQPVMDNTESDIILDCSQLQYISSSGLRIFLSILKNAKSKGHHVYIRGINADITKVFKMTGFFNPFEFLEG